MQPSASILVIDDEHSICLAFRLFFESRGWRVLVASSAGEGLILCQRVHPTVVFLDVRLPDRSGLELLGELATCDTKVIVITAYGDLDTVVRAIQEKAFDYLIKPLDLDKALALAMRVRDGQVAPQAAEPANRDDSEYALVGDSSAMQFVYKLIARVAATDSPVLIEGETGTGKELVARAIHRFGARRDCPFVALNCGAISEHLIESELFGHVRGAFTSAGADRTGRFEAAQRGYLLLDEIADLPLATQVKLLRVLDTGTIERVGSTESISLDVRVLAATNKNLEEEVARGRFRRDLFFRLAVLRISLPPLRDRTGDIPSLAAHFLKSLAPARFSPELTTDAIQTLLAYDWPGNVRELKNAIEHAVAISPGRSIVADDLPRSVRGGAIDNRGQDNKLRQMAIEFISGLDDGPLGRSQRALEAVESALIQFAMERHRGNQSEAANYLGLHRNTLRNKLREFDVGDHSDEQ